MFTKKQIIFFILLFPLYLLIDYLTNYNSIVERTMLIVIAITSFSIIVYNNVKKQ
ncbi:hypothetical protein III_05302 [Bacillus mycoides]|uniref:Uncharacterized protein n=1 Tax=Bacillus mycoides TaxID=1405 RepID=A0ABC9QW62_BACMY|nr:hypothetical protein III_05302 [Bacillus mycoides]